MIFLRRNFILGFCLFLGSCTADVQKQTQELVKPKALPNLDFNAFSRYTSRADNAYAFLWPAVIDDTNQAKIVESLELARGLSGLRSKFLTKKQFLKRSYQKLYCDCVLYENCADKDIVDIPKENYDLCLDTEDQALENDNLLAEMYTLQDSLKQLIVSAGGEWFEVVSLDLNFNSKTLLLNDKVYGLSLLRYKSYWQLKVISPSLELNLDITEKPEFLDIIGELKVPIDGEAREGLLLFQLPSI